MQEYILFLFIGVLGGITSASFGLVFSLTTGIIKKILRITRNKKKKHNQVFMLAKSKLYSIETLISQALMDLEISHEEFKTIVNEEGNNRGLEEKIRMMKSSDELIKNNKYIRKYSGNAKTLKNYYFVGMYKLLDISVEKYTDVKVHTMTIGSKRLFWVIMHDVKRD